MRQVQAGQTFLRFLLNPSGCVPGYGRLFAHLN